MKQHRWKYKKEKRHREAAERRKINNLNAEGNFKRAKTTYLISVPAVYMATVGREVFPAKNGKKRSENVTLP